MHAGVARSGDFSLSRQNEIVATVATLHARTHAHIHTHTHTHTHTLASYKLIASTPVSSRILILATYYTNYGVTASSALYMLSLPCDDNYSSVK